MQSERARYDPGTPGLWRAVCLLASPAHSSSAFIALVPSLSRCRKTASPRHTSSFPEILLGQICKKSDSPGRKPIEKAKIVSFERKERNTEVKAFGKTF